jgi:hypothetical protein
MNNNTLVANRALKPTGIKPTGTGGDKPTYVFKCAVGVKSVSKTMVTLIKGLLEFLGYEYISASVSDGVLTVVFTVMDCMRSLLSTTNHKQIGMSYVVLAIGGLLFHSYFARSEMN